jgi:hypothetical protein
MGFEKRLALANIVFLTEELPGHCDGLAMNGTRRGVELLLEVSGSAG